MKKAKLGPDGPLVTVEEFISQAGVYYVSKGIFPYCQSCYEALDIYGAHSLNVPSRFDHKNRPAEADFTTRLSN